MASGAPAPRARKPAANRSAAKPAARPVLPKFTTAHLEEAMGLLEVLIDEQSDVFVAAGHKHRERHRDGTSRPLTAEEAAQVAAGMAAGIGLPPITLAVAVQESELRAYDEPAPMEILMRAGVATAPAFMQTVKRFTALVEMPASTLRTHREDGDLLGALDAAVTAMDYADLAAVRMRAQAALEHFAAAAGVDSGKALGLLARALWQILEQGASALGLQSGPSSLTGSPPNTDGLDETSSTTSATATP